MTSQIQAEHVRSKQTHEILKIQLMTAYKQQHQASSSTYIQAQHIVQLKKAQKQLDIYLHCIICGILQQWFVRSGQKTLPFWTQRTCGLSKFIFSTQREKGKCMDNWAWLDGAYIQGALVHGHKLTQSWALKPTVHKYRICKFVIDEMVGYRSSTVQIGAETEFCLSYYIVF